VSPASKVHLVSLGCPKNLVDSERLLGAAEALGFAPTLEISEADLIVVNTCAFIEPAAREAVDAILGAAAARKPGARLAVTGCLASRYGSGLAEGLPEVDLMMAPGGYEGFPAALASLFGLDRPGRSAPFESWERRTATPPWRAWLKVAEGCDHRCAYCLIPSIRGPLKVRPIEEVVMEAGRLVAAGAKELTLVAQDLAAWRDRGLGLADLAKAVASIGDLVWLRLMYAYPERLSGPLVRSLASIGKLAPYLDVPFQHASPSVLRRMGRRASDPLALAGRLRDWWPGLALRTTLMVGFPGETEADFDQLVRLVEEGRFDHLGVFKFSPEEGARAAAMGGQLPASVKERRRRALMARQRRVSLALNRARVGTETAVLVEGPSEDSDLVMTGRGPFQAPEVDGLIYFDGEQPAAGQMVTAKLVKAGAYDLVGALSGGEARP
jgi:ribosomal protein S12 methylthiotransferase